MDVALTEDECKLIAERTMAEQGAGRTARQLHQPGGGLFKGDPMAYK
jgi:hypothetical protein